MTTMRFMSTLKGHPTKFVNFDSSPGRAIAKKMGDGEWDEGSYHSELKEENPGGEKIYEISLRRAHRSDVVPPPPNPNPLVVVGILTYVPPRYV